VRAEGVGERLGWEGAVADAASPTTSAGVGIHSIYTLSSILSTMRPRPAHKHPQLSAPNLLSASLRLPEKRLSRPLFSPPSSHSPSFLKPAETTGRLNKSSEESLSTPQRLSLGKEGSSQRIAELEESLSKANLRLERLERQCERLVRERTGSRPDPGLLGRLDRLEGLLGTVLLHVRKGTKR